VVYGGCACGVPIVLACQAAAGLLTRRPRGAQPHTSLPPIGVRQLLLRIGGAVPLAFITLTDSPSLPARATAAGVPRACARRGSVRRDSRAVSRTTGVTHRQHRWRYPRGACGERRRAVSGMSAASRSGGIQKARRPKTWVGWAWLGRRALATDYRQPLRCTAATYALPLPVSARAASNLLSAGYYGNLLTYTSWLRRPRLPARIAQRIDRCHRKGRAAGATALLLRRRGSMFDVAVMVLTRHRQASLTCICRKNTISLAKPRIARSAA